MKVFIKGHLDLLPWEWTSRETNHSEELNSEMWLKHTHTLAAAKVVSD